MTEKLYLKKKKWIEYNKITHQHKYNQYKENIFTDDEYNLYVVFQGLF